MEAPAAAVRALVTGRRGFRLAGRASEPRAGSRGARWALAWLRAARAAPAPLASRASRWPRWRDVARGLRSHAWQGLLLSARSRPSAAVVGPLARRAFALEACAGLPVALGVAAVRAPDSAAACRRRLRGHRRVARWCSGCHSARRRAAAYRGALPAGGRALACWDVLGERRLRRSRRASRPGPRSPRALRHGQAAAVGKPGRGPHGQRRRRQRQPRSSAAVRIFIAAVDDRRRRRRRARAALITTRAVPLIDGAQARLRPRPDPRHAGHGEHGGPGADPSYRFRTIARLPEGRRCPPTTGRRVAGASRPSCSVPRRPVGRRRRLSDRHQLTVALRRGVSWGRLSGRRLRPAPPAAPACPRGG